MGRTQAELLYGSPSHRPISAAELVEWEALEQIRAWEHEQAMKKAQKK